MDDASSALIAKLLAEDQEYALASGYFEEEEDYEDEEDDYRKRRSKKRKKTSSKRENKENSVREQVNKKSKEGQDAGETVEEEKKKKRLTPRRWTEEEESLFEQGLERFGRDWRSISALLNHSRRPRDVASHAQKHFIKLFKEKLPLPAKVRESGEGYTLSGKPLDPQSAAAKAYGGAATSKAYRQQNQNKKSSSAALLQLNQHHNTPSSEQQRLNPEETSFKRQETVEPLPVSQQSLEELQDRDDGKGHTILADAKLLCDLSKKKNSQKSKVKKRQQVYGEDGRTEYSRNRSRRRAANKFTSAVEEALQFVPVSSYTGPPLSGPKSQPFQVQVHSSVYATVDLHAHLSTAEVMGFLAGRFNQDKLTITVEKAFPGSSTLNGETECEMDPVVEVNLRAEIVGQGLKVVGWYHSHPTFQPVPSQCDVVNQANYQILFRDEASDSEPFLGLIMSPYDQRLPSPRSQYSWFYVDSPRINKTPKRIESHLLCEASIPCDTKTRMKNLIGKERAQIKTHAVDFNAPWRTGQEGETITFIEKLRASLSFWLPPLVFSVAGQTMSANLAEDQPNEDPNTVLDDVLQSLNK